MNLKKALKISILTILWTARSTPGTPLAFEAPFTPSKYKKALDACMQVWGDVCVLRDNEEINAERALLIDAALGRMVYLESAIGDIFVSEQVAKPKDADLAYLGTLIAKLETSCQQLSQKDANERVQCMKTLVQNIKTKLVKK